MVEAIVAIGIIASCFLSGGCTVSGHSGPHNSPDSSSSSSYASTTEYRTVCENDISYRIAEVDPRFELMNPSVVFVDREAQFRLVANVKYDVIVTQKCRRESRQSGGTWRKSSDLGTNSAVIERVVYDPNGTGYDEFHPRSANPNRTQVKPIDNKTFTVIWSESGEKRATDHIHGTIVLNDMSKFKRYNEIRFPSNWKGYESADVFRINHPQNVKLVYDITEDLDVPFLLKNSKTRDNLEVEGTMSLNR